MHGFWRELPNYNPKGVQSSEPGYKHASDAIGLFDTLAGEDLEVDGEEGEEGDTSGLGGLLEDELDEDPIPVS